MQQKTVYVNTAKRNSLRPSCKGGHSYDQAMKYVRIYNYLLGLVGHELSAGEKIPSERELCERFGVSRMTVRQAVDGLVNDGILVRKQGRGTFVAHQKMDLQLRITSFGQEMRMRGMVPSTRVLACEETEADASIASSLALSRDIRVYSIRRLRYANGIPMCIEHSWLPVAPLPGFIEPSPPESIYQELQLRGWGPTWGEDNIESVNLSAPDARLLEVPEGASGLVVSRRTFAEDIPIDLTISRYRGDRYKLWVPIAQPMTPVRAGH